MTKILISLGKPVDGFININPLVGNSIHNLNHIEDASAHEVIADGMVDYIPLHEMVSVIGNWTKKLRHRGRIFIGGTDSLELARRYFMGELTTEEFNLATYGGRQNPWDMKSGLSNINEITAVLKGLSLRIMKKRLDGHTYFIEGERP